MPEFDVVITTALIPGRPAPKLIPASAVAAMRPGSVSSTWPPRRAATAS